MEEWGHFVVNFVASADSRYHDLESNILRNAVFVHVQG
jgi:hypothetical protein